MEGKKFYATLAPVSAARNEEEAMQIKMYNAALVGTVKKANDLDFKYATMDDILEAAADAYISAATHVTSSKGAVSYADRCGSNGAIKMSKKLLRKAANEQSMDYLDDNGEWNTTASAMSFSDELSASSRIDEYEEMRTQSRRADIINGCFFELSEKDQALVTAKMAGKSGEEIAAELGCSVGAVHKRANDIKGRFTRLLVNNGYQGLM